MSRSTNVGCAERRALAVLIAVVIVGRLGGDSLDRHLPFVPMLDRAGSDDQWQSALRLVWWTGATLSATTYYRVGALLAGGCELLRVLGNMPLYSNGRTFDALLLIMVGLSSAVSGTRLLQTQYLLLYVGAAWNKCWEAGWWNGEFMKAVLVTSRPGRLLEALPTVPTLMGWTVIVIESAIPLLLLMPTRRAGGVWLCLVFHTAMLLVLREDFSTFYYSVALGAVLLFYPFAHVTRLSIPSPAATWLQRLSSITSIAQAQLAHGPWELEWGQFRWTGRTALGVMVAACLPIQAIAVLAVTALARRGAHDARELILTGVVAGVGYAIYAWPKVWLRARPAER